MVKQMSWGLVVGLASAVVGIQAQEPTQTSRAAARIVGQEGRPKPDATSNCADLAGRSFDGAASIVSAALVSSGTLAVSPTVTLTALPPFCRVQGVSRPSSDSNIV